MTSNGSSKMNIESLRLSLKSMLDWIRIEEPEKKRKVLEGPPPLWQSSQREAPCHNHSGLNNYQTSESPVDSWCSRNCHAFGCRTEKPRFWMRPSVRCKRSFSIISIRVRGCACSGRIAVARGALLWVWRPLHLAFSRFDVWLTRWNRAKRFIKTQ